MNMTEVLLIRHAQSEVNVERSAGVVAQTALGITKSPLTEKGIEQSLQLNTTLKERFGIVPERYNRAIATSEYLRAQQTAEIAGFRIRNVQPLINEMHMVKDVTLPMTGRRVISKHSHERWVPDELMERAVRFVNLVRDGELDYQIYFSHGLFIAAVKLATEDLLPQNIYDFDQDGRGYVPLQTEVTVMTA